MLNILKVHADWISFVLLAILFVVFPQIDLAVSSWFYDPDSGEWWGSDSAVADSIYEIANYLLFCWSPCSRGQVSWFIVSLRKASIALAPRTSSSLMGTKPLHQLLLLTRPAVKGVIHLSVATLPWASGL